MLLPNNTSTPLSDEAAVYALLLIAHRIRNNLFHGNKELPKLVDETDLFNYVNALLQQYIGDYKEAFPL